MFNPSWHTMYDTWYRHKNLKRKQTNNYFRPKKNMASLLLLFMYTMAIDVIVLYIISINNGWGMKFCMWVYQCYTLFFSLSIYFDYPNVLTHVSLKYFYSRFFFRLRCFFIYWFCCYLISYSCYSFCMADNQRVSTTRLNYYVYV